MVLLNKYKTALLVDDNYIDNVINKKILENSKFAENIVVRDSCEAALKYLYEANLNKDEMPEVIFLDIRMPVKTGFDFLKEFQESDDLSDKKIKIYLLSSSLDPHDHKMIAEFDFVAGFLGKPLTQELLKEI